MKEKQIQIQNEYLRIMQEIRKLQVIHRRKTEGFRREFGFLRMIHEHHLENPEIQGIYVNELAERTGITKSGVSKMLKCLEQKGFVNRAVDPKNRRNTFVSLTEKGQNFCECQHQRWNTLFERVSEEFGEERFLETMCNIREIVQIVKRQMEQTEHQQNLTKEAESCDLFCDT